jgi:hypothetical protein
MMRRIARGIAASVLMLLGFGCSDQQDGLEPVAVAVVDVGHEVELRDGRVWLDLPEGGQLTALEELAKAADFELDLHAFRPRRVAIRLEGVTLAEAVAALVGEASFTFEYAFDAEQARHEIAALHVGTSGLSPSLATGHHSGTREAKATPSAIRTAPDPEPFADTARSVTPDMPAVSSRTRIEHARERVTSLQESLHRAKGEERRELRDEYDEATDALQMQFRLALSDPDPVVREEMLEEVEIDSGDARDQIGLLAQGDPDPNVRMAVAETLGDDGTFQSVAELVGMLDDREPDVLLSTLEALDRAGDESIASYVEPLSSHPDTRVRELANEMLEYWE